MALNYTETAKAKLNFERESQSQGAVIMGYHTDNGVSNVSKFMEELFKNHKKIRFSGAGASHQNGAGERAIKCLVTMEMIMFLHAALRLLEDTLSTYF